MRLFSNNLSCNAAVPGANIAADTGANIAAAPWEHTPEPTLPDECATLTPAGSNGTAISRAN